jgi:hypothetical protein
MITIQIKWFRASVSSTRRLNRGRKRKISKTTAPAMVPTMPAKFPNLIATKTMTTKSRRGAKLRSELSLSNGVNPVAATMQHPAPIDAESKRDMLER